MGRNLLKIDPYTLLDMLINLAEVTIGMGHLNLIVVKWPPKILNIFSHQNYLTKMTPKHTKRVPTR